MTPNYSIAEAMLGSDSGGDVGKYTVKHDSWLKLLTMEGKEVLLTTSMESINPILIEVTLTGSALKKGLSGRLIIRLNIFGLKPNRT